MANYPLPTSKAVQADLGAGFVEGVLIALFTIPKNAGRVMVSIFTFVSVRGSLFCVRFIEAPSNSFSIPIIIHPGTTTCSEGIIAFAGISKQRACRNSIRKRLILKGVIFVVLD